MALLIQSGEVQKVGAARKQRYVLPRTVRDVGRSIAVMRIDAQGQPSPFARLVSLAGGAVWVDEEDGVNKRFDGLPRFLDDMRPQGLRGRTFAITYPELQLGNDPRYWSDDDVQRASRAATRADYPILADARISAGFRQIAAENLSKIGL